MRASEHDSVENVERLEDAPTLMMSQRGCITPNDCQKADACCCARSQRSDKQETRKADNTKPFEKSRQ